MSHQASAGGRERFQQALRSSLEAALGLLAPDQRAPLLAAAVGASGIETGSPVQEQGRILTAETLGLPGARVVVTGDERTALRGALGREPGVLVISGTGCIALGQNAEGLQHRCGGWGWLLDGAGSAMDIGRDGLALSVRMADGRVPETPLRAGLWRALGAATAQEVKAAVVAPDFGPAGFAALAPVVASAAAAGDKQALAIVQRSGAALAELVIGVSQALGLTNPPVCAVGGAVKHLGALRQSLAEELALQWPGSQLVQPAGDACSGALELACESSESFPDSAGHELAH